MDTFVDADTGSDTNNCTQATPGGAGAGPCLTVQAAVTKAAPSGTVRIDRGDGFPEAVTLSGGVSITAQDLEPSDSGPAIVDGGPQTAFYVPPAQTAGTIQGLTLRGDGFGVIADGSLSQVTENVFDDPTGRRSGVLLTGATTTVNLNTFTGDGTSAELGVYLTDGSATIRDNTFSGLYTAIQVNGTGGAGPTATPTISGNTITGVHQVVSSGTGILALSGTNATIAGNRISAPGAGAFGIAVNGFSEPATTGATLRRNLVSGTHASGIDIRDTGLAVSLNSDLVTGAAGQAFNFQDQGGVDDPLLADATAANITAWGNGQDITTTQNMLTLDSSIVEDAISATAATCAITFSRGPTTTPGGTGCLNFQTTAAAGFVNAAAGDLHLLSTSPMIDMGNTAAPPAGTLDTDGDPRAIAPTPACTPVAGRRDIGADEFRAPPPAGCTPPPSVITPIVSPVPGAPAVKKCKKGRKLKKGKCVKKKRKRKKKK